MQRVEFREFEVHRLWVSGLCRISGLGRGAGLGLRF